MEALQYRSELLVAAMQLSVIALLFLVNYLTPAGYSPDTPVRSAQLGLSLFTILVLVRLWFAYTKQLTRIFLGFAVVAEMALLLFTIWTYYFQYETTAIVNLKNSHFTYIFVLISLRALRFEPIWVLLSGLTGAIGWSLIVVQALIKSGLTKLTWDYVTYASTRSIYLGEELNKVLCILLVTGIIALVVKYARALLHEAVSQAIAAKDLSRFFDRGIAEKITQSEKIPAAGFGETRQAAILFTDMRGFTKISEVLSANDLIALLAEYQNLLVPIIQKHNGTIDKFIGDGIMASFGAVTSSNTFAVDALNAVDDIIMAVKKWNATRQQNKADAVLIGMGVAVGEIVFGIIGNKERLEYTVIGEASNLAAKLEKQNKIEHTQALTTQLTFTQAIKQGYKGTNKEQRLACSVVGIEEPVNLVVLA